MPICVDPDVRLVLAFDDDRLDPSRALWFVRNSDDLCAMPCNAVAWKGDELHELSHCRNFFRQFPAVFIAIADKEMREFVADAFESYLPSVRVFLPADHAFKGFQSVAEVIKAAGSSAGAAVDALCIGAYERPAHGLLNIADVKRPDRFRGDGVLSGFAELDRDLGGFRGGELSVWTGKRGEGKSTLLSQLLLEAIDQGARVCAFSGELDAWRFKSWAMLQAAGRNNLVERVSGRSGKRFFEPTAPAENAINAWWNDSLWLYDNRISGATEAQKVLSVFEVSVLRYGCTAFLVDNLMTTDFSTSDERDYYRRQSNFVGQLADFAKRNGVHVHLVAHPRKFDKSRGIAADDVGGSSGVTDRADNVFSLSRVPPESVSRAGCDCILDVLKNRADGVSGRYSLNFEPKSRRYYRPDSGDPDKKFGWEPQQQEFPEVPAATGDPF